MPIMNFDLQDGKPPVSFSINNEGAERFMVFMAECQAIRDSAAVQSLTDAEIDAEAERHGFYRAMTPDDKTCEKMILAYTRAILAAASAKGGA